MSKQVRLRRGTTAQHATFTGAQGEITFDTDKNCLVVHDGVTPGGKPLSPLGFVSGQGVLATIPPAALVGGVENFISGLTEAYDDWAALNASTGIFTVPTSGLYFVEVFVAFTSASATTCSIHLRNGALDLAYDFASKGPGDVTARFGTMIKLSVSQQLRLLAAAGGAGDEVGEGYWKIHRIG